MIDKARAARAGTLGDYVHPCPVDRRCLDLLGLDAARFAEIAQASTTGRDVLERLAASGARSAAQAWFDPVAFEHALQHGMSRSGL